MKFENYYKRGGGYKVYCTNLPSERKRGELYLISTTYFGDIKWQK